MTQLRFHNRYPHARPESGAFLHLWREYRRQRPPRLSFPRGDNDPAWLAANRREDTLTWIGHDTFLVQWGGLNLLTDPIFSARASPLSFAGPRRLVPPALAFETLPPIDVVLVSHNHYDHLDAPTIKRLIGTFPDTHFVVPAGLRGWFTRRGAQRVVELEWWQGATLGTLTLTAVPAQHFSGRSLRDRNHTLWCGFIVEAAGRKLYFAGDTGYSRDFADIGARCAPIDAALIPIGAYEPRWFMRAMHVNPEDAVRIHQDIGARLSVAMHWGTFRLTTEALDEPPRRLATAVAAAGLAADCFRVLRHGETLRLGAGRPERAG